MRYGSVCSGIEAATVAWHPLGWRASFYSEIEPFPRAVLQHHYPSVPLHGDFTTIERDMYEPIDLLAGGTPCQSFSIAGLRGGLADDRGNLSLEFIRLAERLCPRWLVWENVPGVLSSNKGRDFGAFLGGLAECGYGFAYRVLDAQHFGVPQRRRRVVLVGYFGNWRAAAAVLFERESLCGDITPCREAGEAAPTIPSRSSGGGGLGTDFDCDGGLITARIAAMKLGHTKSNGWGISSDGQAYTLEATSSCNKAVMPPPHAFKIRGGCEGGGKGYLGQDDVAFTVATGQDQQLMHGMAVRRLNPRECERLQGFPDDYTLVPYRVASKKKLDEDFVKYLLRGNPKNLTRAEIERLAMDSPRYKAIGNSWAVPKFRWIGERIHAVNSILKTRRIA